MKSLIYPLILLFSLFMFSQETEEEFTPIVLGDKEAFLSSKTGEYVYRSHEDTDPTMLQTTDKGVVYKEVKVHKVKAGESLYKISKKMGVSITELKSMNKLSSNNLKIGQELKMVKTHSVASSSPVVSQAEGKIIARLAPGQTPNGMTPPDLPPDSMPGSTINLVVDDADNSTDQSTNTEIEGTVKDEPQKIHVVKGGESLFSIAKKYRMSIKDLKELNNLALNNISVGQKLKISVYNPAVLADTQAPSSISENTLPEEDKVNVVMSGPKKDLENKAEDNEEVTEQSAIILEKQEENKNIQVKVKDSLQDAKADKEKVIEDLIKKYGNANESETEESSVYIVQKGDSLWSIAKKHNLTLQELKSLNKLDTNVLSVGQKLKIK
ncbi:MAG: LysM peptidoglycan-binding domain-containing protein [Flavobacteriaceae bacterium]|nr:MAG: LysM peptidoglycan-binding domain-containing protein [Flavobacteriaceae bacterium]